MLLFARLLLDPMVELREVKLAINLFSYGLKPGQQITIDKPVTQLDVLRLINEDVNLIAFIDGDKIVIKKVTVE